mmetsp:Transcript_1728/g.4661  ORF Transcript_1728/g.4661 Transcript_1728/m.4661 type:complete len:226 (-) Transcript_1728:264-941(-)
MISAAPSSVRARASRPTCTALVERVEQETLAGRSRSSQRGISGLHNSPMSCASRSRRCPRHLRSLHRPRTSAGLPEWLRGRSGRRRQKKMNDRASRGRRHHEKGKGRVVGRARARARTEPKALTNEKARTESKLKVREREKIQAEVLVEEKVKELRRTLARLTRKRRRIRRQRVLRGTVRRSFAPACETVADPSTSSVDKADAIARVAVPTEESGEQERCETQLG